MGPYAAHCCVFVVRMSPACVGAAPKAPRTPQSAIWAVDVAINGIQWDVRAASKGTLRVHAIRRAQTCVYMGVSAAVEARNQCWYGFWALRAGLNNLKVGLPIT